MYVKYMYVYVHNFHVSPCLLQFSSMDHFTPGTYFKSEDLCNPEIDSDDGCVDGQCEKLRRGLCALPPFKRPRTLVKKFCLKNDHNTQLIKLLPRAFVTCADVRFTHHNIPFLLHGQTQDPKFD